MDLSDLANDWNNFKNATLGRGTAPNDFARDNPELAQDIQAGWDAFQSYKADAGPFADAFPLLAASEHVERLRALSKRVEDAGLHIPGADIPPPTLGEQLAEVAGTAAIGLGVVAGLYLTWKLVTSRE